MKDNEYYENLDKRTTEYKEYKKGLGDRIADFTKATGIDKIVEAITDDCGCAKRKKQLNNIRGLKPRCMTEQELNVWKEFRDKNKWKTNGFTINDIDIELTYRFYINIFELKGVSKPCRNCSPKPFIRMIKSVDTAFNEQIISE